MAAVNFHQIRVHELLHDPYLLESLVDFERIDMDLFKSVEAFFIVADEVYAAETSLSDYLQGFIGLHS